MSTQQSGPEDFPAGGAEVQSEEELRAAYEAELNRMSSADMIAQAAVSLLNVGARRLGPADPGGPPGAPERDLEQVRDAIDAVRPLLEILERRVPEGLRPLRDALAQLQIAYAREVQADPRRGQGTAAAGASERGGAPADAGEGPPAPGAGEETQPGAQPGPAAPGPAQRSGRLWVPGS